MFGESEPFFTEKDVGRYVVVDLYYKQGNRNNDIFGVEYSSLEGEIIGVGDDHVKIKTWVYLSDPSVCSYAEVLHIVQFSRIKSCAFWPSADGGVIDERH